MIKNLWVARPFNIRSSGAARGGVIARENRGFSAPVLSFWFLVIACPAEAEMDAVNEGFVTVTFGSTLNAQHPQTLKIEQHMMHLDLWSLPKRIQTR
jgi:hypothetical protein